MPLTSQPDTQSTTWQASDYGLLTMAWDPAIAVATVNTPLNTAGRLNIHKVPVPYPMTVTNIVIYVTTAGVTLTSGNCKAALYQDLNLIGTTADQSAVWNSTGLKTMALVSGPFTLHKGLADIALWYNGTTAPSLMRGVSASQIDMDLQTTDNRTGLGATAITTTPPSTITTNSGTGTTFWVALS